MSNVSDTLPFTYSFGVLLLWRALKLSEKRIGPEHPKTLNNLAIVLVS